VIVKSARQSMSEAAMPGPSARLSSRQSREVNDWALRRLPAREPAQDRSLWRFLTWPFFLGQLGIAERFEIGRKAGIENDDLDLKHVHEASGPGVDEEASTSARMALADDPSEISSDASSVSQAPLRLNHPDDVGGRSVDGPTLAQPEFNPVTATVGGGDGGVAGPDGTLSAAETSATVTLHASGLSSWQPLGSGPPIAPLVDGGEGSTGGITGHVAMAATFATVNVDLGPIGAAPIHWGLETGIMGAQLASIDIGFGTEQGQPNLGSEISSDLETALSTGGSFLNTAAAAADAVAAVTSASSSPILASTGSGPADYSVLQSEAGLSYGGTILFPEAAATGAQIDQLFVAGKYTDYHVALQSEINLLNSAASKAADPMHAEMLDHPAAPWATAEGPAAKHDTSGFDAHGEQNALALTTVHHPLAAEELCLRSAVI
jgi:hypothetical protein